VLVGVAVGAAIAWLRRQLDDPPVEITVSLLTPFAAYLPAEQLGFSGVLATVTRGLFIGWFAPRIMESDTRLRGRAVWDMLVFMLNSLVFILIGLQLSGVVDGLSARPLTEVIAFAALISLTVIVVRLAWIFGAT
jgi:NhaP-type Na+/H+ or K+/H+ antiporter